MGRSLNTQNDTDAFDVLEAWPDEFGPIEVETLVNELDTTQHNVVPILNQLEQQGAIIQDTTYKYSLSVMGAILSCYPAGGRHISEGGHAE